MSAMTLRKKLSNITAIRKFYYWCRSWEQSPWLFRSYLRYRFCRPAGTGTNPPAHFLTVRSHTGANIGHQLTNCLAGHLLAQQYGLTYVHHPFSRPEWETFLDMGYGFKTYDEIRATGIRVVRLPQLPKTQMPGFLETALTRTYHRQPVLFYLNDLSCRDLTGTVPLLRQQYEHARQLAPMTSYFTADTLNVALHIRRGDVAKMRADNDSNWRERWVEVDYFVNVARGILQALPAVQIVFHVYSQGNTPELDPLRDLPNVHFHLDEDARTTFHHMTIADILVCSPSSFSFKAGMISRGIKLMKYPWWHEVPDDDEWIRCQPDGTFPLDKLARIITLKPRPTLIC